MSKHLVKVLYAISIAWFVLFVWIGTSILLETPTQMAKDKAFIKEEFDPKIAVIEHFKADHHRLPEVSEYEQMVNGDSTTLGSSYIRNIKQIDSEIKDQVKGVDWSNSYVLAIWRGEWLEYYISANQKYITNNFQWYDGVMDLLFGVVIGCIPGISVWLYKRRRNKAHAFSPQS
jgi:hypothetical protein